MKEKVISNKKYIFHLIAISFLILYLLSADFLFDHVCIVNGQSKLVEKKMSDASEGIRYNIDHIYEKKIEWKEMITITGWAFIDNQNTENSSIYLVFDNTTARYVFTTTIIKRPDVSESFNKSFNGELYLDNSGFEANIPKVYLDNNRYQLGILIENQTAQTYIVTNNYCTNGNCSFSNSFSEEEESQIVDKNLPHSSEDIQYNIDSLITTKKGSNEILTISGWGFIRGQNTENTSTYLVLNDTTGRYVFTTKFVKRPDVSEYFNKSFNSELNLDNSGFKANIPKVYIDNNRYQLGILIENQTAQTYIVTNSDCTNGNCSINEVRIRS